MCCATRLRAVRIVICAVVTGALILLPAAVPIAFAQQGKADDGKPAPRAAAEGSSSAAISQYRSAVALQNRGVYDLARDEWATFLEKFSADPLAPKARHYLGICQLQLKDYEAAIKAFTKVIKDAPQLDLLDATYLNLGLAQYSRARGGDAAGLTAARESLAQMVEKFPKSPLVGQAWFYLGEIQYAQGQKAEAAKTYAMAMEKETSAESTLRPEIVYALGVTQEELGDHAAAGATYDLYLKEFPDHKSRGEVIVRRGETLFATGKFAGAEKWFAAAAAIKDFDLADHATMRQAASLFAQQQYPAAAAKYAAISQAFPQSKQIPAATLAAGNCYYLAGDMPQAEAWLARAIKLGGDVRPEAAHWLARAYLKQNRAADALQLATRELPAAGEGPFAVALRMDQAEALYEQGDQREQSIELFAELARKFPDHASAPQALYMSAFAALGAGRYDFAAKSAAEFRSRYASDPLTADVEHVGAEAALQLGQYAGAAEAFARLVRDFSDRPQREEWQVRRGLCLYLDKKYDAAIAEVERLVESLKKPEAIAEAHYVVGSSLLAKGQNEAAAKRLAASIAAQPKWRAADEALLNLAAAQRQLNLSKEAAATIGKLLADFPESKLQDRAHFRLAEIRYAAGDNAGAEKEYRLVLENWPKGDLVPHALYGLGWALLGQNQHAASIDSVGRLLERYPQHALVPKARFARAMARQQSKQFEPAIADLAAFLAADPPANERSDAYYVHALCLVGLEKYADAIKQLETLLAKDPQYAAADKVLYELGWAHKSLHQDAEANRVFAQLSRDHAASPLAAEAAFHVGEAHYLAKEYDEAAKSYADALNKAGATELGEKAAHKLGWAYYQQGEYEQARQAFEKQTAGFAAGPLASDGLFMAAESLFKQANYDAAAGAYQAALSKPPANAEYHALALLHAGQCAGQQMKWREGLSILAKGGKDFPQSAYRDEMLYEQAWCEQNLNQADAAQQHYEEVAARSEREVGARARFMLGEILFEKKEFAEAVKHFFKVAYGFGYPESPEAFHKWQANAVYEAARCFEALKRTDQAKKSYREIVERYPNSDKASLAKDNLARLGG